MIKIVLGSNFGDEGKGAVVSKLVEKYRYKRNTDSCIIPLYVVRFNGGHQVGHTVIRDNIKHVFSNFGSGTLYNIPTYWSRFCTVSPIGILNEFDVLVSKGFVPELYIDPLCPIVTPFDVFNNQKRERENNHGSVGVGFGSTIQRQEDNYKLFAQDLKYKSVLKLKLKQIAKYYNFPESTNIINEFIEYCEEMLNIGTIHIKKPKNIRSANLIFEGAQGILLDMDFGFFPHVTRSNTTSKNAFEVIKELEITDRDIETVYVTRPYITRHGEGPLPFSNFNSEAYIQKNPNETNVYNEWQGEFKYSPLNLDLLKYSFTCDSNFSKKTMLYITCIDQVNVDRIFCVENDIVKYFTLEQIVDKLGFDKKCKTLSYKEKYEFF